MITPDGPLRQAMDGVVALGRLREALTATDQALGAQMLTVQSNEIDEVLQMLDELARIEELAEFEDLPELEQIPDETDDPWTRS